MSRIFNGALTGVNENYIHTPANSVYNTLSALTMAAWIFSTDNTVINGTVFAKNPTGVYSPALIIQLGQLFGQVACNTSGATSISVGSVALNGWSHVAMTFNNATDAKVHLYLNGVEVTNGDASVGVGGPKNDSADGFYFGNDTFGDGFTGDIAEVVEYNTALTAPQIATLAASTTGATVVLPANIVGYWHLLGTTSPEPDSSGSGNSGVLSTPNVPAQGPNSPGYTPTPPVTVYSVPDCRKYATFPNASRNVNATLTYDVQTSSNSTIPPVDSRVSGAPVASGTYPQNSRTPGTYGPGE